MTPIHFLSAADGTCLTKRFHMTDEGLVKEPYPQVASFNSHEVEVPTIEDFYAQLVAHADKGYCLLKGQLDRPLKNESRAGHTNPDSPTEWMVLDNDNLDHLEPQQLMDLLGIGNVDYIVQYSASAGVVPGKRGYHIFFLLDQQWRPSDLKLVLRAWNLDNAQIRKHFQLSRTHNSLRWPLDISVCQNDKLIYIAPPTLGAAVKNTLEGDRIRLVKKERRVATLTLAAESEDVLRQREEALINELRKGAGLPTKTFETGTVKGEIVAKNPDQARVSGEKEERGFVYLNLNGGDSWGYYHPVTSPEVLYNFKGEPNYLIEELLPDYYPQALARAEGARETQALERQRSDIDHHNQRIQGAIDNGKPFFAAFRDKKADQYYAGWIDPGDRSHNLDEISTTRKIEDLCKQYGIKPIKTIPSVNFRFEPANDALYDTTAEFINRYTPSRYLKDAQTRDDAAIPSTIKRLIRHALGEDDTIVEHFLNWLAVVFRYRIRTETAWIFQGTTGTGKGLLFNEVIRPLIGENWSRIVSLGNLEEQFNAFVETTIVLSIDEVDTDQVKQMPKLMARFKTWITGPKIPLRGMRQNLREVPNHLNLILSSNQPNSMRIEANDRRFNVCPRQEAKLLTPGESGDEFVEQIRAELQAFADYLISHEADKAKARDALENDAKRQLQAVTTTAIEEVADAMRKGNLEYFFDHRPLSGGPFGLRLPSFDGRDVNIRTVYREFLDQALRQAKAGKKHVIQHEHLFAVFELLVGDMPKTKTKLTKRLGHVNLAVATHSQGNKSIRGFGVEWVAGPTKVADWSAALAQEENDFERSNQVQGRRLVRQVSDPKDNSNGTDQ